FYFLEMNTRLQVEHPITELVTGIDLVKQQIRIAAGEKLAFRQRDIVRRGAALECRVYAEDPDNNFFPCPGLIRALEVPSGPGVRDDSGVYAGWTVPVDYDPLLSKLATWGNSRQEAIERMKRALDEYYIGGIKTNLSLFQMILRFPDFREGKLDTGLIDRLLAHEAQWSGSVSESSREALDTDRWQAAALAAAWHEASLTKGAGDNRESSGQSASPWKLEGRRQLLRPPSFHSKP
ncbi:MAG: acetyl-CoA carboxylase biotin carboxylase subunit, partial [Acidobacteria bacterium]|nr:acetyl-CoA carboxylase biotin carboxylase subunit [Acidobacteriota bacterium]